MKKNKLGEPIVTRREGATFYCLECGRTYQKCKCRVYVSADTLRPQINTVPAQERPSQNGD